MSEDSADDRVILKDHPDDRVIVEDDVELLPCNLECCIEEWKTYVKLQKSKVPPGPPEHVVDIEEPIKIFLFDMPRTIYSKTVWGGALYTAANVVIGSLCVITFMYAYVSGPFCGDMYSKLTKKLHVPLQAVGILLHASLGIMAFSKFYDSSQLIKWKDRRTQHEKQMLYSVLFIVTDIILFVTCNDTSDIEIDMSVENATCPCDVFVGVNETCLCPNCKVDYVSFHFIIGGGALLCYALAAGTGILLFLFLKGGAQGTRGQDTIVSDVHTVAGLAAYFFFLVAFCATFLYPDFNKWMTENYGPHLELMVVVLTSYLFFIALISPGLRLLERYKKNLAKKKFKREARETLGMNEIEKNKKLKAAKEIKEKKETNKRRKEKKKKKGKNKKEGAKKGKEEKKEGAKKGKEEKKEGAKKGKKKKEKKK